MFSSLSLSELSPNKTKKGFNALANELGSLADFGKKRLEGQVGAVNKYNFVKIFEEITKICCKQRTNEDIDKLIEGTKDLTWFVELNSQKVYKNRNVHYKICKHLKMESYDPHQTVFQKNDAANKFFLVLQGILICYGPRSEVNIKRDKNALKYIQDCGLSSEITSHKLEEIVKKDKQISNDLKKSVVNFESIQKGQITYKKSFKKQMWDNFNPDNITEEEIYDQKTGIMIQKKYIMIKTGEAFGDIGLLYNNLRAASILTLTNCKLGYISQKNYISILMEAERINLEKKVKFFNEVVFKRATFDGSSLEKLCKFFTRRYFKKGMYLFKQGDEPKFIYAIKKGEVKTFATKYTDLVSNKVKQQELAMFKAVKKANNIDLCYLGVGEFVGDLEFVDHEKRLHSAICMTDCKVFELNLEVLRVWIKNDNMNSWITEKINLRANFRNDHLNAFSEIILGQENEDNKINLNYTKAIASRNTSNACKIYKNWKETKKNLKKEQESKLLALIGNKSITKNEFGIEEGEEFIQKEPFTNEKHFFKAKIELIDKILKNKENLDKNLDVDDSLIMVYNGPNETYKGKEIFKCDELKFLQKQKIQRKFDKTNVNFNSALFCTLVDKKNEETNEPKATYMKDPDTICVKLKSYNIEFVKKLRTGVEEKFDITKIDNDLNILEDTESEGSYENDSISKKVSEQKKPYQKNKEKRRSTKTLLKDLYNKENKLHQEKFSSNFAECKCLNKLVHHDNTTDYLDIKRLMPCSDCVSLAQELSPKSKKSLRRNLSGSSICKSLATELELKVQYNNEVEEMPPVPEQYGCERVSIKNFLQMISVQAKNMNVDHFDKIEKPNNTFDDDGLLPHNIPVGTQRKSGMPKSLGKAQIMGIVGSNIRSRTLEKQMDQSQDTDTKNRKKKDLTQMKTPDTKKTEKIRKNKSLVGIELTQQPSHFEIMTKKSKNAITRAKIDASEFIENYSLEKTNKYNTQPLEIMRAMFKEARIYERKAKIQQSRDILNMQNLSPNKPEYESPKRISLQNSAPNLQGELSTKNGFSDGKKKFSGVDRFNHCIKDFAPVDISENTGSISLNQNITSLNKPANMFKRYASTVNRVNNEYIFNNNSQYNPKRNNEIYYEDETNLYIDMPCCLKRLNTRPNTSANTSIQDKKQKLESRYFCEKKNSENMENHIKSGGVVIVTPNQVANYKERAKYDVNSNQNVEEIDENFEPKQAEFYFNNNEKNKRLYAVSSDNSLINYTNKSTMPQTSQDNDARKTYLNSAMKNLPYGSAEKFIKNFDKDSSPERSLRNNYHYLKPNYKRATTAFSQSLQVDKELDFVKKNSGNLAAGSNIRKFNSRNLSYQETFIQKTGKNNQNYNVKKLFENRSFSEKFLDKKTSNKFATKKDFVDMSMRSSSKKLYTINRPKTDYKIKEETINRKTSSAVRIVNQNC